MKWLGFGSLALGLVLLVMIVSVKNRARRFERVGVRAEAVVTDLWTQKHEDVKGNISPYPDRFIRVRYGDGSATQEAELDIGESAFKPLHTGSRVWLRYLADAPGDPMLEPVIRCSKKKCKAS